jgi:hypothetical protein
MAAYGKDKPENFISGALRGGKGASNQIEHTAVDRPHQVINTARGLDNVKLAMDVESSLCEKGGFAGGVNNLKHSLTGASAVNEEVGASGSVKHVIIPNH